MRTISPCKGCAERSVEPNCHNPDICQKWAEWCEIHNKEKNDEFYGRLEQASFVKQTLESCGRNRYYQSRKKR